MKDKVKLWFTFAGAAAILWLIGPGCGGGGGSSTGTGTGNIVRWQIEATKNGAVIDPTNIVLGETVQFRMAGYDASGNRSIQSASGWVADPTGQTEGTMSSNGQFATIAYGPAFTVSATSGGNQIEGAACVKSSADALVTGHVIDGLGDNVPGVTIDFYDVASNLVGTSVTQFDGTFRAAVPSTAVTFEVDKALIPAGYYKEYLYGSNWYLPQGNCRAPLPSLTGGVTTALSGAITLPPTTFNGANLPPPPPPSPCN